MMYAQKAIEIYESLDKNTKTDLIYYIAIVDETCGSGCGIIGKPGIEIDKAKFEIIYTNYLTSRKIDTLIFYELGRNFWFYNTKLLTENSSFTQAISTGFSVFMRNICVQKLSIDAGPINTLPYHTYYKELTNIFNNYLTDSSLNISVVMIEGKLPLCNSELEVTKSNFWGSLLIFLYNQPGFGDEWLTKIWAELYKLPSAKSENELLKNFYSACQSSVNINIKNLFCDQLKWIVN